MPHQYQAIKDVDLMTLLKHCESVLRSPGMPTRSRSPKHKIGYNNYQEIHEMHSLLNQQQGVLFNDDSLQNPSDLRESTAVPASAKILEAVYNLHVNEARSRELFLQMDQGTVNFPGFDDEAEMSCLYVHLSNELLGDTRYYWHLRTFSIGCSTCHCNAKA